MDNAFALKYSLSDMSRWNMIKQAISQTNQLIGEVWECGCWKGGTGLFMKAFVADENVLRLFDTFAGMPNSSELDYHKVGDMAANYEEIVDLFKPYKNVFIHKGIVPDSFIGLEDTKLRVVHIDLDQYESVKACLAWVYPRVVSGGWIVFDDYNCTSCLGAHKAINDFLLTNNEFLNVCGQPNPQAYLIKK